MDLYTGSLFQARKHFAQSSVKARSHDRWFIVSAKHGLTRSYQNLQAYDLRISDLKPHERREWALDIAGELIYQRSLRTHEILDPARTTISLHMGADYVKYLAPVLEAVGFTTIWPVKGMSQGAQLQWYAGIRKLSGEVLSK